MFRSATPKRDGPVDWYWVEIALWSTPDGTTWTEGEFPAEWQTPVLTSFKESTFDAVLIVNLLHVVHDPASILQECSRVVRDGGRIVVADVTSQGTQLMAGIRLSLRYLRRWGRPPASNQNLSLNELVRLTQQAGFLVKDEALIGGTVKAACLTGYTQTGEHDVSADPEDSPTL